jgi:hypothetical protein
LEDLLKVKPIALSKELENYQAMIGGPNDLYLLSKNNSNVLDTKWNSQLVPAWYYEPVAVEEGGQVLMDIVTGDDNRSVLPGVVLSHYGKGKVIYSATSMESLFRGNGNPVIKDLIANLISIVAPSTPTYSIQAPSALVSNMTTNGKQYLLHLTNWTGNKFEKTHVMEDYIAPAEDVRIELNFPPQKIASIKSLTGSTFTIKKKANSVELFLPKVGAYEGILINLQ